MPKDRIETELRADSTQLRAEFTKAQQRVRRFTDGVKSAATSVAGIAAGAIGIRAGVQIFGELGDKFDRIGKLSNRFNLPEEDVQRLAVASEITGSNIEKMVAALTKATVAGVEAEQGMVTYSRAFEALNINVDEFNAASPDQKLSLLAGAFSNAKNESEAFTAAYRILGKSGGDLIPLLRENSDGIKNLTKNLETLSGDDVKAIEDFNDQMTVLKSNLQAELAREFAGELAGMKDEIAAVATGLVSATKFIIDHRKAITLMVGAWAAYKGIKVSASLVSALAVMIRTKLQLTALAAVTQAETTAVTANSAAHLANARARALGAVAGKGKTLGRGAVLGLGVEALAAKASSKGGAVGKLFGKAMGASAGARFGLGFIAKFSPHVLAAAVGAAVGKPLGDAIAGHMGDAADRRTADIAAPLNSLLSVTHELVNSAKTQQETDAARARIKREIKRLTEEELAGADGQKRAEVEHTIAVLKQRDAMADTLRLRNVQTAEEAKIAEQKRIHLGHTLHVQKVNQEALAQAEKRLVKERQIAAALREQIGKVRNDVVETEIDLLPAEDKVKIFTERLKQQLKDADFSFNSLRPDEERKPISDTKDLFAAAGVAQSEGRLELAKNLLERLQKIQQTEAQITRATEETKRAQESVASSAERALEVSNEKVAREKELAQAARETALAQQESKKSIAAELAILKLKAAGRNDEAEALQRNIDVQREAKRISEETGITEKQALEIARQKAALKQALAKPQGGGGAERSDEGLRDRLRRERQERINAKRAERAARFAASGGDGVALSRAVVRQRQRDQQLAPDRRREGSLEKFDRLIGQNEDLLKVWQNLVPSS